MDKIDSHLELYISTAGFNHLADLSLVLRTISDLGIKKIELSGGLPHYHGRIIPLLDKWKKISDFRYLVHHYFPAPHESFLLNIASTNQKDWKKSIRFCKNSIRLAKEIGSPIYGIHPGYTGTLADRGDGYFLPVINLPDQDWETEVEKSYAQLLKAIEILAPFAKINNVALCFENLFPLKELPPQHMVNVSQWKKFFEDLEGFEVGFLFDIAHLKISERIQGCDFNRAIHWVVNEGREYLREIHVSGTNGSWDNHTPITENDWIFDILEYWSNHDGWPDVPLVYESRNLDPSNIVSVLSSLNLKIK